MGHYSRLIVFLVSTCLLGTVAFVSDGRDLTTTDGTTYKKVKVTKKTPLGIEILYEKGATFINYKDLSPEVRKEFGYSAHKAQAYLIKQARDRERRARLDFQRKQKNLLAARKKLRFGEKVVYEYKGTSYLLYLPVSAAWANLDSVPVLCSVHDTVRDADAYMNPFLDIAEKKGIAIVAPCFDETDFVAYQYILFKGEDLEEENRSRMRSDLRLLDILDEVKKNCPMLDTDKLYLFGFSGGAQFVSRFATLYPQRVKKGVAASAGSYLFPKADSVQPIGIRHTQYYPRIDLKDFLALDFAVLCGDADVDSLDGFKSMATYDFQGKTRLERMLNYYAEMKKYATEHKVPLKLIKRVVPGEAHSPTKMVPLAKEFLFKNLKDVEHGRP